MAEPAGSGYQETLAVTEPRVFRVTDEQPHERRGDQVQLWSETLRTTNLEMRSTEDFCSCKAYQKRIEARGKRSK